MEDVLNMYFEKDFSYISAIKIIGGYTLQNHQLNIKHNAALPTLQTQDYKFVSSKHNKEINDKYNLTGNKEIPEHYDGFEFSANSPTAQALNNSEEFKNQILSSKNYDSTTGAFKTGKLEIEFNNDKNLQYSFGHMTVLEPKIENGYITGTGYDKYNYEAMYGKKFENVSQETKSLNNKARFLQATGKLKNYYVLVPIKIKI